MIKQLQCEKKRKKSKEYTAQSVAKTMDEPPMDYGQASMDEPPLVVFLRNAFGANILTSGAKNKSKLLTTANLCTVGTVPKLSNASLCIWERHFTRTIPLLGQEIYQLWWHSLTKDCLSYQVCLLNSCCNPFSGFYYSFIQFLLRRITKTLGHFDNEFSSSRSNI